MNCLHCIFRVADKLAALAFNADINSHVPSFEIELKVQRLAEYAELVNDLSQQWVKEQEQLQKQFLHYAHYFCWILSLGDGSAWICFFHICHMFDMPNKPMENLKLMSERLDARKKAAFSLDERFESYN
jgi:hypothetical protein